MAVNRVSWLLRIDSDPVCYLWTGFGPLETPADAVDPAGATWLGAGHIIGIPGLQALINGVADRVNFTLSGVSPETLRLAREDKASVKGAQTRIGHVVFDQDWQLTGPITWEWLGIADALRVESRHSDDGRVRSIILMVGGADTSRSNPRFTFWTDASQRLRSPTDAFCDHVAMISQGVTRRFGPR
jgi:hypothetical protein